MSFNFPISERQTKSSTLGLGHQKRFRRGSRHFPITTDFQNLADPLELLQFKSKLSNLINFTQSAHKVLTANSLQIFRKLEIEFAWHREKSKSCAKLLLFCTWRAQHASQVTGVHLNLSLSGSILDSSDSERAIEQIVLALKTAWK